MTPPILYPLTTLWEAIELTKKYHSAFLTEANFEKEEKRTYSVIDEELNELHSSIHDPFAMVDALADVVVTALQYAFVRNNAFATFQQLQQCYIEILSVTSVDLTDIPQQDILTETGTALARMFTTLRNQFGTKIDCIEDQHLICFIIEYAQRLSLIQDVYFPNYLWRVAQANWDKRISFKNSDKGLYRYDVTRMLKKTTAKYRGIGIAINYVRNDSLQCYMPVSAKDQTDTAGQYYCEGKGLKRYGWESPEKHLLK